MSDETIKVYQTCDIGASQCLVTLECFIGDVVGAELADGAVIEADNAVTAINGLIWSLEQRDAKIGRLQRALTNIVWVCNGQLNGEAAEECKKLACLALSESDTS